MFNTARRVRELEEKVDELTEDKKILSKKAKERDKLEEEVERLKLKKKIEEEDIKHMVKLKEERLEIEHQKRMNELEREKEQEIAKVKDEYRDKMEARLIKEGENIKDMHHQILKRLPDVNVRLNGKV